MNPTFFLLLLSVFFSPVVNADENEKTIENPCIGQSDFKDGRWVSDYRKKRWLCRCDGIYFPPNDSSNRCYQNYLKKHPEKKREEISEEKNSFPSPKTVQTEIKLFSKPPAAPPSLASSDCIPENAATEPLSPASKSMTENTLKVVAEKESKEITKAEITEKKETKEEPIKEFPKIEDELVYLKSSFKPDEALYESPKKASEELKKVIAYLKKNPHLKIRLIGVTDTNLDPILSSYKYKLYLKLAKKRATTAKNTLLNLGLPASKIKEVIGAPSGKFLVIEINDGSNYSENRRIAIEYLNEKGEVINPLLQK